MNIRDVFKQYLAASELLYSLEYGDPERAQAHVERISRHAVLVEAIKLRVRSFCVDLGITGVVSVGVDRKGINSVDIHNALHGIKKTFWLNKILLRRDLDGDMQSKVSVKTDARYTRAAAGKIARFVDELNEEMLF